jgi:DNA-binding transcriptional LysR family regulator
LATVVVIALARSEATKAATLPTSASVGSRRILLRQDVARSELTRLDPAPVEVRVAASPLAAPGLLAGALRDLRTASPQLLVLVRTVDTSAAVAEVASGRADVALVDGITAPDNPVALTDAGLRSSTALVDRRSSSPCRAVIR